MKKIIRYSLALVIAVLAVSCKGFLEENPTTSLSESSVYNSESSLEAQVLAIYRGFCSSNNHMGNTGEFLMTASGLIHWKSNRLGSTNWTDALKFTENANSSNMRPFYSEHYTNVNRCNRLLDNLPDSPVDAAYKKEIEAETKMLRALNYYYLVRLYGDIPLFLKSPGSVKDCSLPRTPFWEVYKAILDDLTFAEQNMRDEARVIETTGTTIDGAGWATCSRPHKMAATALKAHVYMTIASLLSSPDDNFWDTSKRTPDFSPCGINSAKDAWQLCYDKCKEVMESGKYELAPTFKCLFNWARPEDFNLKERIITFTSSNQITYAYLSTRTLPAYPAGTLNTTTVNNNSARWRPDRWVYQKWCETYPGTLGSGEKNANIYVSSSDPRHDITYMHYSYQSQQDGTLKSNGAYPANNYVQNTGSSSYPVFKKYLDPNYDVTSGNCALYVLRYAEVILMRAEAAVELSESVGDTKWDEAYDLVDMVHKRARESKGAVLVPETAAPAAQPQWDKDRFADKASFIEGIFWERVFELSAEEHEYYDTHRRGATWLANTIAKPKNIFLQLPEQADYYNANGDVTKGVRSYFYGENFLYSEDPATLRKSLLLPIPTDEYSYNAAIDPVEDLNDYHW